VYVTNVATLKGFYMLTTLTTDEIVEMAKEAGFTSGEIAWHDNMFETFAKLVAEKSASVEREACAKVIENDCIDDMTREEEAAAIRARGEPTSRGGEA